MNLIQMLSDLRAELAAVDDAIAAVGRIAQSHRKPRGRPPAWLNGHSAKLRVVGHRRKRGRPPKS
jgi:hypothetical protein